MALFFDDRCQMKVLTLIILCFVCRGIRGATFTLVNKRDFTIWPGIVASSDSSRLDTTGFEFPRGDSRSFPAPPGWSGRFWGRTGCNFDDQGLGSCAVGDCGSGQVECNGAGAVPPATTGGYGTCATTGCATDVNRRCPVELRAAGGAACKSACDAFGTPEYCCSGAYGSPDTCKPSEYSLVFKTACPKSYSYAYDDASSTFTCSAADYTITFCPNSQSLNPPGWPILPLENLQERFLEIL